MSQVVYENLGNADFIIDCIYKSMADPKSSIGSEPLHKLLPVGTMGGFRKKVSGSKLAGLVLTSTMAEPEWPDSLDLQTGEFTYFGDNRTPGHDLHSTKARGNAALRDIFNLTANGRDGRVLIPLILIFETGVIGRDFIFRGLAVPGTQQAPIEQSLIAIWKSKNGSRFQNYQAKFTILDTGTISGSWVREVFSGKIAIGDGDAREPKALTKWISSGGFTPLVSERVEIRSLVEQQSDTALKRSLVNTIYSHCKDDPFKFEHVASEIWKLSSPNSTSYQLTRRYKDGGRDATGSILLGPESDPIKLSFALEAKLYEPSSRVGVKATSRLISRIRHREFGVLVTTASVDSQAYKEVRSDSHPIIIISGRDVAEILITSGIQDLDSCQKWLDSIPFS